MLQDNSHLILMLKNLQKARNICPATLLYFGYFRAILRFVEALCRCFAAKRKALWNQVSQQLLTSRWETSSAWGRFTLDPLRWWSCRWFPKPNLLGLVRNPPLISSTSAAVTCCDPDLRPRAQDEHYRLSAVATDTLECWIICGDEGRASSDAGGEEVRGVTVWFHRDARNSAALSLLMLFLLGSLQGGGGRGQEGGGAL